MMILLHLKKFVCSLHFHYFTCPFDLKMLWFVISGVNRFKLSSLFFSHFRFIPGILFKLNKNYSKLNDLLFTPANKGYYHIPGISLKRLICTMYLDFELFDIHTKKLIHINIAYNVP